MGEELNDWDRMAAAIAEARGKLLDSLFEQYVPDGYVRADGVKLVEALRLTRVAEVRAAAYAKTLRERKEKDARNEHGSYRADGE